MIYVIKGQEEYFINNKITELTKGFDVVKFDGSSKDFNISDMLEACNNTGLFSDKNIVLVKDPYFLIKKCDDKETETILNYVNNPLYETDLILYTLTDSFNGRLKLFKDICNNAQLITFNSYDYKTFNNYVRERINVDKLNITNDAAYYLNQICKRNATLLNQNLEILKLYPEKIDNKVIDKLCTFSDDNISFDFINAIVAKDVSKAIEIQKKLLTESDSALSVIGLLATQLRFLYQVSYLFSTGKNYNDVINITGCNEIRLNKAQETLKKLNKSQIINLLGNLSDLDCKCKTNDGLSDASRFELFILNLLNKGNYASN